LIALIISYTFTKLHAASFLNIYHYSYLSLCLICLTFCTEHSILYSNFLFPPLFKIHQQALLLDFPLVYAPPSFIFIRIYMPLRTKL
jgi:hypothetical protein